MAVPNSKNGLVITRVVQIARETGVTPQQQPVLYFTTKAGGEYPRGYLLYAKCDIESLKAATAGQTIADITGKRIQIIVGEHRGKAVLRISPQTIQQAE